MMKKYVVMTNYHTEGWKISGSADSFHEAVALREEWMSLGNSQVVIFKLVEWTTQENEKN